MKLRWDAIVVGAGPAGALAARGLARRGLAVLLVEREAFPRWKVCGCCLNGRALATLAQVGLGDLPNRCGAVPLHTLQMAARGASARVPLPGGVVLSRLSFDAALVEAAVQAGVTFLPRTWAALGAVSPVGRRVQLHQDQWQAAAEGRVVLAAQGLGGERHAAASGFQLRTARAARIGAGAIADTAPEFYRPGTIFMACGADGYLGLVRLEDGRLDLAAALNLPWVRHLGGPGVAAARLLAEAGWPVIPGVAELPWRGTPRLTRRLVPVARDRILAVGDAAGYVEPFTGEGIAWALAAAAAVAPLAVRAAKDWQPALAAEWSRLHRQVVVRRQAVCRLAARALHHPALVRSLLRVLALAPGLARPVLHYLNAPLARAGEGP